LRRAEADLERYVVRCGFGDGGGPINLVQVVDKLKEWPEWCENAASWLAAFSNALNTLKAFCPASIIMASGAPQNLHHDIARAPVTLAGGADVSGRAARLWVLWGEPIEGRRRCIGELWRDAEGYAFSYVDEVQAARAEGFRMLPEFPELNDVEAPYRARYLFPTFAQRIPSPKRRDFDAIMASWGVAHADNPLEVLAASGGVQMTDRIELSEHRPADDDLAVPLFFGWLARGITRLRSR
jgi:hypothetical protein